MKARTIEVRICPLTTGGIRGDLLGYRHPHSRRYPHAAHQGYHLTGVTLVDEIKGARRIVRSMITVLSATRFARLLSQIAMIATVSAFSPSVVAQAGTVTFVVPAIQGPGNPGFGTISDPTIQPYLAPGIPPPFAIAVPVDLQGNGRPDIFGCHAAYRRSPRLVLPML